MVPFDRAQGELAHHERSSAAYHAALDTHRACSISPPLPRKTVRTGCRVSSGDEFGLHVAKAHTSPRKMRGSAAIGARELALIRGETAGHRRLPDIESRHGQAAGMGLTLDSQRVGVDKDYTRISGCAGAYPSSRTV